jgi:hypothetical protein
MHLAISDPHLSPPLLSPRFPHISAPVVILPAIPGSSGPSVGSRIAERRFGLGGNDIEVEGDSMGVEDCLCEYSIHSFLPTCGPPNTPTLSTSMSVPPLSHSPSSLLGLEHQGLVRLLSS